MFEFEGDCSFVICIAQHVSQFKILKGKNFAKCEHYVTFLSILSHYLFSKFSLSEYQYTSPNLLFPPSSGY